LLPRNKIPPGRRTEEHLHRARFHLQNNDNHRSPRRRRGRQESLREWAARDPDLHERHADPFSKRPARVELHRTPLQTQSNPNPHPPVNADAEVIVFPFLTRCLGTFARRAFLRSGLIGWGSLSLAELLRCESRASASGVAPARKKSMIVLWLWGGPSHMETF